MPEASRRAHGEEAELALGPRELIGHRRYDAGSRRRERMADRNRAAVEVQDLRIHLAQGRVAAKLLSGEGLRGEGLEVGENLRREGFMHFHAADVREL